MKNEKSARNYMGRLFAVHRAPNPTLLLGYTFSPLIGCAPRLKYAFIFSP